jgi:hypothetical protein
MTMTRNEVVGSFVADLDAADLNEDELYALSVLADDPDFKREAGAEFGIAVGETVDHYVADHPEVRFAA